MQADVGVIVSLQQDKDLHHWGVNIGDLQHRAQQLGITYERCPVGRCTAVDTFATTCPSLSSKGPASQHRATHKTVTCFLYHSVSGLLRPPAVHTQPCMDVSWQPTA